MAIFSDTNYLEAIDEKDFLVRPFRWNDLLTIGYRIHLGPDIYREKKDLDQKPILLSSAIDHWQLDSFNIPSPEPSVELKQGETKKEKEKERTEITLSGKETVLVSTKEFLYCADCLIPGFKQNSETILSNMDIIVCPIQKRFTRYPVRITNKNDFPIILNVGTAIGFLTLELPYDEPMKSGSEVISDIPSLKTLLAEWKPEYLFRNPEQRKLQKKEKKKTIESVLEEMDSHSESISVNDEKSDYFDFNCLKMEGVRISLWPSISNGKENGGGKEKKKEKEKEKSNNSIKENISKKLADEKPKEVKKTAMAKIAARKRNNRRKK